MTLKTEEKQLEEKQLYEGMYIISSSLSEEARGKALDRIRHSIEEKGGEIHKIHDLGPKKLAYEIRDRRDGFYYIIYFSLLTKDVSELWQEYHLNEDLIRFITLRTDKVLEEIKFKQIGE